MVFIVLGMRIISLVPSLTETLIYLGLEDDLVGRTKFCVHPAGVVDSIPVYGGTKNPHVEKIIEVKPDLIIANKEENRKEDVDQLRAAGIKVLVTDIPTFEFSYQAIVDIGEATNRSRESRHLVQDLQASLKSLQSAQKPLNVLYVIWKKPWMTIGGDTYISSMLDLCGWSNIYRKEQRYPAFSLDELKEASLDAILLSSEPYPFQEKDRMEVTRLTGIPTFLVDGEAFSWYGSRFLHTIKYLNGLISKIGKETGRHQ